MSFAKYVTYTKTTNDKPNIDGSWQHENMVRLKSVAVCLRTLPDTAPTI